jgi:nucleoside 2-deoxyribosyltransferase
VKIYLAGPEVFHPEAEAIGRAKAALCAEHGFEGRFPLDATVSGDGLSPHAHGLAIYRSDIAMMNSCDAIIANLTPFRGPHADPGTALELGYMLAQGKPCLAYSTVPGSLAGRLGGGERDAEQHAIEHFDMADNLMLEGAASAFGGIAVPESPPTGDPFHDFRAFETCLQRLRAKLTARRDAESC